MAREESNDRRCFTFIWKLENVSNCLTSDDIVIISPVFVVDELYETNWNLEMHFSDKHGYVGIYLLRHDDEEDYSEDKDEYVEDVELDCELAFLSSDNTVLHSWEEKKSNIVYGGYTGTSVFLLQKEVFFEKRSVFLPQDSVTIRCRIWKSEGEMSKNFKFFARTSVEKRSFPWNIKNFSALESNKQPTYETTSLVDDKKLMSMKLLVPNELISDDLIRVKIAFYEGIEIYIFKLSILDSSKISVNSSQDEVPEVDVDNDRGYCKSQEFILFYSKSELLKKKDEYLQNDVLSLWCECFFTCETEVEEIEMSDHSRVAKDELDIHTLGKIYKFSDPCDILTKDLKSMLNNSSLSDVKLRTKSQTYSAHTFILGARSPVFKAMFSNDMKEKIRECVDIDDTSDDTVMRMLQFIYSAEVKELNWDSAAQLYEAADKYEILNLKDICSSYLKSNLVENNACQALKLADLHQDSDLKSFVQAFILKLGKDIITSRKWDQLMESDLKLAAETMRLKYIKKQK